MLINGQTLDLVFRGFQTVVSDAFAAVEPDSGATNPWANTADLIVSPCLA